MNWSDIPKHPTRRALRQFAAGLLVCFVVLGARQYFGRGHHALGMVLGTLGVVLGGLGLWRPVTLRWLFTGWMVLAFPVGWVVSQVMLAIMFYGVLTPVAVLFRLRGRDLLARRRASRPTLWTAKPPPRDVRSYFRQY